MFVESLSCEVTKDMIDGYAKEILESDLDDNSDEWGTTKERLVDAWELKMSKATKKKVENVIKKMPKDT